MTECMCGRLNCIIGPKKAILVTDLCINIQLLLHQYFFLSKNWQSWKYWNRVTAWQVQHFMEIMFQLSFIIYFVGQTSNVQEFITLHFYNGEEIKLLNYFWSYKVHSSILSENIEHFHVFNLDAIHSILIHWLCIGSWQQYYPDIKCKNQNKIFIICWVSAKRNPRWLGCDLSAIDWPVPYGERTITDHFGKRD